MSQTSTTLYSVKGHTGAHVLSKTQEAHHDPNSATPTAYGIGYLVGGDQTITAPLSDWQPFTMAHIYQGADLITALAQEAAVIYNLEPQRIAKAADLARNPYSVQQARRDEHENPINKSIKVLCVKGSSGWYVVRPNFCTCPDHTRGNVCKHRIAAWIHREAIVRPLAQARRVAPAVVLAELTQ